MSAGGDSVRGEGAHYICECRLNKDFFVHGVDAYFDYDGDDAAFMRGYGGRCWGDVSVEGDILPEVRRQRAERVAKYTDAEAVQRRIAAEYTPLHPELREFREGWLDPAFVAVVAKCRALGVGPHDAETLRAAGFSVLIERCTDGAGDSTVDGSAARTTAGVASIPNIFSTAFREKLVAELIHFAAADLPYTRPNTMNRNGGVLLAELGFGGFLDVLVRDYLTPVCGVVCPDDFADVGGGAGVLDSHKAFTVAYRTAGYPFADPESGARLTTLREDLPTDAKLAVHTDNAEATVNIHLAGDWHGGDLNFYGQGGNPRKDAYETTLAAVKAHQSAWRLPLARSGLGDSPSLGLAVLHTGSEFHEACPITSGWRLNLVLWLRASGVRNRRCPMCMAVGPSVIRVRGGPAMGEGFTSPPCKVVGCI